MKLYLEISVDVMFIIIEKGVCKVREHDFVLADDIDLIKQQLNEFSAYNFAEDIAERMESLGLSQNVLASRAHISHAMVGRWLNKGARPHGKERFKELGMALAMDEKQLNIFLEANCYPRLYAKNPLDIACRFVLSRAAGNDNTVRIYRDFLRMYKLEEYVLRGDPMDIDTPAISRDFANVKSVMGLEEWLVEHSKYFRAYDKFYIPNAELIRFALLYIGNQSVNNLYIAGELPVTIKNLLYPLMANKEVAVKGLRSKLIVFGLYENMTEYEINIMLTIAKLQPVTDPSARIDSVILTAIRCAHERYPYFEFNNAERVLHRIEDNGMTDFRVFYEEQKRRSSEFVNYYETAGHKNEIDRLFEMNYTDYVDKGILHYLYDILSILTDDGTLTESEISEFISLMKTY